MNPPFTVQAWAKEEDEKFMFMFRLTFKIGVGCGSKRKRVTKKVKRKENGTHSSLQALEGVEAMKPLAGEASKGTLHKKANISGPPSSFVYDQRGL